MQTTLQLFVGSNNETHEVEHELLIETLGKYHEGFTIQPAVGYWMGAREDSVTVLIHDEHDAIISTIHELKQVLKQDAIAYQQVAPLELI